MKGLNEKKENNGRKKMTPPLLVGYSLSLLH